jgi:hypothetical protein
MLQQVQLARKRGQTISDKVAAKTFLKNIVDYAKKDSHGWVAMMLRNELVSLDAGEELPPKFELRQLAANITTAITQPSDLKSMGKRGVNKAEVKQLKANTQAPPSYSISECTKHLDSSLKMNDHIQGYNVTRFLVNEVFRPTKTLKPMRKPMPNPSQARRFGRPRRPYEPNTKCDACNRWGHKATRCDMLAMAVWIMEFINNGGSEAVIKEITKYWTERNANEQSFQPTERPFKRDPVKVMQTYMDRYCFTAEQVADELDWRFVQEDYAEECEPDMPYEELMFATSPDSSEGPNQE